MLKEKMDAAAIGQKLRALRGERPQEEVATAIGVSKMTVSQYETGKRIPRDDIKVALARYFNTTVEQIFFSGK